MRLRVAVVLLLMLLAPGAALYVASPVGEVGTVPVGVPVTFHVVAAGDDGVPTVHTDALARVLLDGAVVYEASAAGGHEYDGVHTFTVTFPRAGSYQVQALDGEEVVHEVTGTVTEHPHAGHSFSATQEGGPRLQHRFDVRSGDLHSETMLHVRETGRTVLRTELHEHADLHRFSYTPGGSGEVKTVHSALQVPDGAPAFAPFVHILPFDGGPRPPAPLEAPAPVVQPLNTVAVGEGDGMRLVATFDPYTLTGPQTLTRLALLALDPDGVLMPHTQFTASLTGPAGEVFASESIHEHDGLWEIAHRGPVGTYTLAVHAENGDADAKVTATWNVVPPVVARSVGTQTVTLELPEDWKAGEAQPVTARITDAQGTPFDHGEIEVEVRDARGVPVLLTKVHAHDDGVHTWTMALPEGEHTLHLDPYPLESRPIDFEGDLEAALHVPAGQTSGVPVPRSDERPDPLRIVPLFAGALVLAAVAVAAARRTR